MADYFVNDNYDYSLKGVKTVLDDWFSGLSTYSGLGYYNYSTNNVTSLKTAFNEVEKKEGIDYDYDIGNPMYSTNFNWKKLDPFNSLQPPRRLSYFRNWGHRKTWDYYSIEIGTTTGGSKIYEFYPKVYDSVLLNYNNDNTFNHKNVPFFIETNYYYSFVVVGLKEKFKPYDPYNDDSRDTIKIFHLNKVSGAISGDGDYPTYHVNGSIQDMVYADDGVIYVLYRTSVDGDSSSIRLAGLKLVNNTWISYERYIIQNTTSKRTPRIFYHNGIIYLANVEGSDGSNYIRNYKFTFEKEYDTYYLDIASSHSVSIDNGEVYEMIILKGHLFYSLYVNSEKKPYLKWRKIENSNGDISHTDAGNIAAPTLIYTMATNGSDKLFFAGIGNKSIPDLRDELSTAGQQLVEQYIGFKTFDYYEEDPVLLENKSAGKFFGSGVHLDIRNLHFEGVQPKIQYHKKSSSVFYSCPLFIKYLTIEKVFPLPGSVMLTQYGEDFDSTKSISPLIPARAGFEIQYNSPFYAGGYGFRTSKQLVVSDYVSFKRLLTSCEIDSEYIPSIGVNIRNARTSDKSYKWRLDLLSHKIHT